MSEDKKMLVLTVCTNDKLHVRDGGIEITVLSTDRDRARLGFEGPAVVLRDKVLRDMQVNGARQSRFAAK